MNHSNRMNLPPESHKGTPAIMYVLAIVSGIAAMLVLSMTTKHEKLAYSPTGGDILKSAVTVISTLGVMYAALGFVFGLISPQNRWRWGFWVSSPFVLLLLWAVLSFNIFALFLGAPVYAAIVLFSCLGAHFGSKISLRK